MQTAWPLCVLSGGGVARESFSTVIKTEAKTPRELVHTDACGKIGVATLARKRYVPSGVDGF